MGGAKNCPETPRQKMIGMMYLVLTAMLALNVSAEIIKGFDKIRISMESSMVSTEKRTEDTYAMFKAEYEKDDAGRAKYGDWWKIAQSVHDTSEEFYNYIENFKLDIANMVDSKKGDEAYKKMPEELKGGSDTNKPHQYALSEKGESGLPHAEEFEAKMVAYREYMTVIESPCIKAKMTDEKFAHDLNLKFEMFKALFNTDPVVNKEGETKSWADETFNEMPAAAVLALLTKYQNDVRMAENDMINFMWSAAGTSKFTVNKVTAVVQPKISDYVSQGQVYEARVVSGAVDTTNLPQVFVNGQELPDGIYRASGKLGENVFSGYILMPGDTTHIPFKHSFFVSPRTAVIANSDLDMMYSGYDNNFAISVPGYAKHQLSIECDGAKIVPNDSGWVINPKVGKSSIVRVYATVDGKRELMGSKSFRTPKLPDPFAAIQLSGKILTDEKLSKQIFTSGKAELVATYGPDSPIRAKFKVVSFEVKLPSGKRIPCQGGKFSADAIKGLNPVKAGADIKLTDVVVKEPNGSTRTLKSLSIELK